MPDLEKIQTLAALRKNHIELLTAWTRASSPAAAEPGRSSGLPVADVAGFIACLLLTARLLQDPGERDAARGMFDYWSTALAGVGEGLDGPASEWPNFSPEWARRAVSRAEAALANVPGSLQESVGHAVAMLLESHPGSPGPTEAPPMAEADLLASVAASDRAEVQRLLHALAAEGVIRRTDGRSGAALSFSFRSVARAWPLLMKHCEARHSEELVRDRLLATAELWDQQKGDASILLSGASLEQAAEVLKNSGSDSVGGRFVQASQRQRVRTRNRLIAGLLLIIAGLIAALLYLNAQRRLADAQRRVTETQRWEADAQRQKAERLAGAYKAFLLLNDGVEDATASQGEIILRGGRRLAYEAAASAKPPQVPLEQLEVRTLICDGSPSRNRNHAKAMLNLRVPGARGRWRRDYLSQPANASPAYQVNRVEIRYNPEEEDAADRLQKLMRGSLGLEAAKVLTFFPSPASVSVLFCDGANPRSPTSAPAVSKSAGFAASEDTEAASAASPWFAVVSSVPLSQASSVPQLVASLKGRIAAAGVDGDVLAYCTRISRSIALTSGGPMDERKAQDRARLLRSRGVVADAFAQPDRGWVAISAGAVPDCRAATS